MGWINVRERWRARAFASIICMSVDFGDTQIYPNTLKLKQTFHLDRKKIDKVDNWTENTQKKNLSIILIGFCLEATSIDTAISYFPCGVWWIWMRADDRRSDREIERERMYPFPIQSWYDKLIFRVHPRNTLNGKDRSDCRYATPCHGLLSFRINDTKCIARQDDPHMEMVKKKISLLCVYSKHSLHQINYQKNIH